MEFKHTPKVHCGNLLHEVMYLRADLLNLTDTDVDLLNLTEAVNDTTVEKYQKLLELFKDTGCNDQVDTQFRDLLVGSPPNIQYQERTGTTYDEYMLFLTNQGSVSKLTQSVES